MFCSWVGTVGWGTAGLKKWGEWGGCPGLGVGEDWGGGNILGVSTGNLKLSTQGPSTASTVFWD